MENKSGAMLCIAKGYAEYNTNVYGREIGVLGYVCMHGIPENRELHVRPLGIDWYSLAYREHNWLWRISFE